MVSESFLLILKNKLLINYLLRPVIYKATVCEGLSYNFHIKPSKNIFERIFQICYVLLVNYHYNNVSLYAVVIQPVKSTLELSYAKTVCAFSDGIVDDPLISVVDEVNSGI